MFYVEFYYETIPSTLLPRFTSIVKILGNKKKFVPDVSQNIIFAMYTTTSPSFITSRCANDLDDCNSLEFILALLIARFPRRAVNSFRIN